jgi:hypothetical protein
MSSYVCETCNKEPCGKQPHIYFCLSWEEKPSKRFKICPICREEFNEFKTQEDLDLHISLCHPNWKHGNYGVF